MHLSPTTLLTLLFLTALLTIATAWHCPSANPTLYLPACCDSVSACKGGKFLGTDCTPFSFSPSHHPSLFLTCFLPLICFRLTT